MKILSFAAMSGEKKMLFSTEVTMEQSAKKDGKIKILEDELVRCILSSKRGYCLALYCSLCSEHHKRLLENTYRMILFIGQKIKIH